MTYAPQPRSVRQMAVFFGLIAMAYLVVSLLFGNLGAGTLAGTLIAWAILVFLVYLQQRLLKSQKRRHGIAEPQAGETSMESRSGLMIKSVRLLALIVLVQGLLLGLALGLLTASLPVGFAGAAMGLAGAMVWLTSWMAFGETLQRRGFDW